MNQLQESILASEKQAAGQTAEENIAAAGLHKRVHDKADKIAQRMASDTVFSKAMDAQDKSKSKSISGLVDWIRTMILTFFNAIINIFNYLCRKLLCTVCILRKAFILPGQQAIVKHFRNIIRKHNMTA